jgi:hypothetical protein
MPLADAADMTVARFRGHDRTVALFRMTRRKALTGLGVASGATKRQDRVRGDIFYSPPFPSCSQSFIGAWLLILLGSYWTKLSILGRFLAFWNGTLAFG